MIYPILIEFFIVEIVGCVMVIDMKNLFQGYASSKISSYYHLP